MSAFYNIGKDEMMVREQMKDMRREAEQFRLVNKSDSVRSGKHLGAVFGNALIRLGKHLQGKNAQSSQALETSGGKYAV
ncbi:MAG TPA: hypothetical protein VLA72_17525 [Anaerolineales bacterium]|nr:hypothetical protein [Anaerolineales bacterium]